MNDHSRESGGLVFTLIGTAQAVQDRLEGVLVPFDLSLAKLQILHYLADSPGPVSLSELAAHQKCVRSNITQIVDRLEKDRLVKRRADPTDRRGVQAMLTAAGRRAYHAGWDALIAEQRAIVQELGAGPANNLKGALELLR
jgi:DNA-binding MarR family transcriptional regulator